MIEAGKADEKPFLDATWAKCPGELDDARTGDIHA